MGGVHCADFSLRISGKIQLPNQPSHSFYHSNRLESLLCKATRSVVISLVYWSATACAIHTTLFRRSGVLVSMMLPRRGRSTSCQCVSSERGTSVLVA